MPSAYVKNDVKNRMKITKDTEDPYVVRVIDVEDEPNAGQIPPAWVYNSDDGSSILYIHKPLAAQILRPEPPGDDWITEEGRGQ